MTSRPESAESPSASIPASLSTASARGSLRDAWTLDPEIAYLNHGSFGATPRSVLEVQAHLRQRMEREPVRFLAREAQAELERAKESLARFVGAEAEDLGAVSNATSGVNAVLRSLRFEPGDELLTTSHGYNACANTLRFVAERWGAKVVVADVPFPLKSSDEITEAVLAQVSVHTRFALLDHITSPTAVVFPVEDLARALKARGIAVMIDGAHAPGMLDLDLCCLESAGVDYYTGNCHKWMCAPKGAAFLWVKRSLQSGIHPAVISHGANASAAERSRFRLEFDWVGTDDPTAFLSVPAAIEHLNAMLPGGWPSIREHNHKLVLAGRQILCESLGAEPPVPASCIGSIASLRIPDDLPQTKVDAFSVDPHQARLFDEHNIEVPIFFWPQPPKRLLRISAQLYNSLEDYEALAAALAETLTGA